LKKQHRYFESAAFFILGGQLKQAAEVLAANSHDIQLALVITKLVEGDSGPV